MLPGCLKRSAAVARRPARTRRDARECRSRLELGRSGRYLGGVGQNIAATVPKFSRQDAPRRASRYQVRVRAARTAAWLAGFESHGRCRGLWLDAFRTIFGRVPAPLWRDAIANPEAASPLHQRPGIDARIFYR